MTCEASAIEIHTHLLALQAERAFALIEGLALNPAYMADLDEEIEATATMTVLAATYVGEPDIPAGLTIIGHRGALR
jgi:hypothetical protein